MHTQKGAKKKNRRQGLKNSPTFQGGMMSLEGLSTIKF
jgi:hypothetical protein